MWDNIYKLMHNNDILKSDIEILTYNFLIWEKAGRHF